MSPCSWAHVALPSLPLWPLHLHVDCTSDEGGLMSNGQVICNDLLGHLILSCSGYFLVGVSMWYIYLQASCLLLYVLPHTLLMIWGTPPNMTIGAVWGRAWVQQWWVLPHATYLCPLVLLRFDLGYTLSILWFILFHDWHLQPHVPPPTQDHKSPSGSCICAAVWTCCSALSYARLHSIIATFCTTQCMGWSNISRMYCLQNQVRYTKHCVSSLW